MNHPDTTPATFTGPTTFNGPDADRRAYWARQMQAGYDLVQQVLPFPVVECLEPLVSIPEAAAAAGVEMLFSTSKIAGDLDRVFFIRRGLIDDVITVGRQMNERGWILKIEDGYRSLEMQSQLVRKPELFDAILAKCIWEYGGELPPAELVFRRAIVLIANIPKIGTHMSASAIDVSVFRRDDGSEVWRGNPYLEMSERTPMRSPFVEPEALANRLAITEMLEAQGFVHFPFEFWHFNKSDAMGELLSGRRGPAKYGPVHWNPTTNEVTACTDPLAPLNPLPVIEREIAAARARAEQRR
ncbi:MAG: M15 family metallopeptidase [Pirellulales bacterium]